MNRKKLCALSRATLGWLVLAGVLALVGMWGSRLPVAQAQGPDGKSTYTVAPGGSCGAGINLCYSNVQAAIDAVDDDDDVTKVASGVYTGVNNYAGLSQVAHVTKGLTIRGGYTASDWDTSDPQTHTSTLGAGGQGRVAYVAGDISVTLDSLQMTGGDASGLGGGPFADTGGGARPCLVSMVVD